MFRNQHAFYDENYEEFPIRIEITKTKRTTATLTGFSRALVYFDLVSSLSK